MNENFKFAKFASLYEKIPKDPEVWTMDDVQIWLNLIDLEDYADNFAKMKIDGLIILDLEEADLEEELKITVKLHKKKMTKAIELLKEYHKLYKEGSMQCVADGNTQKTGVLTDNNKTGNKSNPINKDELTKGQENKPRFARDDEQSQKSPTQKGLSVLTGPIGFGDQKANADGQDPNFFSMAPYPNGIKNGGLIEGQKQNSQPQRVQGGNYIIINSIEGNDQLSHTIDESGAKIGRHSSNKIVIYDESVSRHHAEIYYNSQINKFVLNDVGSTTGTFLKIVDPVELCIDNIIEIGSYQLLVTNIFIASSCPAEEISVNSFVEFAIYESPEEIEEKVFCLSHMNSIGRKTTNNLCFSDDLHMSNLHCKINFVGNKFYFEDMASTNGSWLRLSKETMQSKPVILQNRTIFKIGNSAMYEVTYPAVEAKEAESQANLQQEKMGGYETNCSICLDAERDCLIMPCRHNVSCTRCIKSVKNCPVCRTPITDIIRIYKA